MRQLVGAVTTPYRSSPNRFRRDLQAGKTLIGCWASLANGLSTELLGYAGFDWLLLDGEHAPNDYQTFIAQLHALKDSPSAPFVRPEWLDTVAIKRLLDIGFCNFLIPFVESPEQAATAVAATRYPPRGVRGVSTVHRAAKFGLDPNYFETIDDDVCVVVQIESRAGVEAAGEIAAVEGVDALFIGPSDLSAAYGFRQKPGEPIVQEAIERVLRSARSRGKACGILAPVEAEARRYLQLGMTFVAVGGDVGLLRSAAVSLAERFKGR